MTDKIFIAHLDMDAFFASVEQRDKPWLRKRPVIVGADPKEGSGRGVVSTCSYEARKFGIHSAMPISIAYKRCPKGVFLRPDMEKYEKVSSQVYSILYDFTPKVEVVSIDEAFLDLTGSFHIFGGPVEACLQLKSRIKNELGLTASVGLAPTMMVAKIASDINKPDGFVEVKQEKLFDFLWPLDVGKIWGLGNKSKQALNSIGIRTIGELAKTDKIYLEEQFGKSASEWWQLANGIDQRRVSSDEEAKSISNEITFDKDTKNISKIESSLLYLCEKVSGRLRRNYLKARTVTLKIRLQGFKTYTRSMTLNKSTNFSDVLYKTVKKLFRDFDSKRKPVRLIGVKTSGFIPQDSQDSLLNDSKDAKKENIHKAIQMIEDRFGYRTIYRAGGAIKKE